MSLSCVSSAYKRIRYIGSYICEWSHLRRAIQMRVVLLVCLTLLLLPPTCVYYKVRMYITMWYCYTVHVRGESICKFAAIWNFSNWCARHMFAIVWIFNGISNNASSNSEHKNTFSVCKNGVSSWHGYFTAINIIVNRRKDIEVCVWRFFHAGFKMCVRSSFLPTLTPATICCAFNLHEALLRQTIRSCINSSFQYMHGKADHLIHLSMKRRV